MLRAIAASRRLASPVAAFSSRGALAPAGLLAQRAALSEARRNEPQARHMSSKLALSKMGTLSVDPLAASSTVQGVEYVLTGFDKLVNWARKSSLWPMTFGLA